MNRINFLAWTTGSPDGSGDPGSYVIEIVVYSICGVILLASVITVAIILLRGRKNREIMKDEFSAENTDGCSGEKPVAGAAAEPEKTPDAKDADDADAPVKEKKR